MDPAMKIFAPSHQQLSQVFDLRYRVLRAPWDQPRGSEQDELEGEAVHRALSDQSGRILATGRLHPLSCRRGQIRFMAVEPEWQGRGLGGRLLHALEQAAQASGLEAIELQAREEQAPFYLARGYRDLGQGHTLFGAVPHRRMAKLLPAAVTRLTDTWHATIPLSEFMQVEAHGFDGHRFETRASFERGRNLHGTLFAGAGYSQATLTGWGRVWLELQLQGVEGEIVLARAEVNYSRPVRHSPHAWVEAGELDLSPLSQGRNAKVPLTVQLADGLTLEALFAVLPPGPGA
ncbi:GNAT family N-acetyltransferase [Ferrimonas sediminicola]|uniref:GNAT family N-acetyltransferase n=1 Tax=Ferrimonas sediminicola TaxID=2569538 RepID=A0A4U1BAX9_9GAMM|nr:bifunctional GNAT family N-acetyltransferase/hotdog fold thioesterase [Ferrimonas sediminicola]TKB47969.1 GNAT family N-acetyltransferase [Ferrimonas sediminicola]